MSFFSRLRTAQQLFRLREFAVKAKRCPFCGMSLIVRLRADEIGLRCVRCGASAVHLSIGYALRRHVCDLAQRDVCELSARGPMVTYLKRHARSVSTSEYFADVEPGSILVGSIGAGVRCEDVQQLTYADASFDLVTHTEVLEHVPDDARAYSELRRILRPGGLMLFTVPLTDEATTVERASLCNGRIDHLMPPAFHGDPLREGIAILVFRDYGRDIVDRLQTAGFVQVRIELSRLDLPWDYARAVIHARR